MNIPESVKELARSRPVMGVDKPSIWPLRNSEGKTWAQVRAERDAAEALKQAA